MSFEFDFTEKKLSLIIPKAVTGVSNWYTELYDILPSFEITSIERVSAFLAQTAHESGGYTLLKENLNYSADSLNRVFPKYFIKAGRNAAEYHRQPEKIANVVYANRMGNGDTMSGDGWKYRGRGLIQLTGKNNYEAFATDIDVSIDESIEYLETVRGAVHSACWYWHKNNLNEYADNGDFVGMTKRINGGTIGLEDRVKHYEHALEVLA